MKRTWIKNARIVNEGKIFHGSIVIENEDLHARISIADLVAKAKHESIDIVQLLKSNMPVVEVTV